MTTETCLDAAKSLMRLRELIELTVQSYKNVHPNAPDLGEITVTFDETTSSFSHNMTSHDIKAIFCEFAGQSHSEFSAAWSKARQNFPASCFPISLTVNPCVYLGVTRIVVKGEVTLLTLAGRKLNIDNHNMLQRVTDRLAKEDVISSLIGPEDMVARGKWMILHQHGDVTRIVTSVIASSERAAGLKFLAGEMPYEDINVMASGKLSEIPSHLTRLKVVDLRAGSLVDLVQDLVREPAEMTP